MLYDEPLERSAANAGKEFLTDAEVETLATLQAATTSKPETFMASIQW